jgi:hypothetical protein
MLLEQDAQLRRQIEDKVLRYSVPDKRARKLAFEEVRGSYPAPKPFHGRGTSLTISIAGRGASPHLESQLPRVDIAAHPSQQSGESASRTGPIHGVSLFLECCQLL